MLTTVREKTCPSCQSEFHCTDGCWCNDFPRILPMNKDKCLCKSCLTIQIQTSINEYVRSLDAKRIKTIQKLGLPSTLIEGIDYSINANGNWVFSSWYLLRQGKCCTNDCTHCPYPKKESI